MAERERGGGRAPVDRGKGVAEEPRYVQSEGFSSAGEPGMVMPPTTAPGGMVPGEVVGVPSFAHEPTSSSLVGRYDYDQQSRHLGRQRALEVPTYVQHEGFLPPRELGGSMFMPPTVLAPWGRVPGEGMVVPSFAHEPTSSRVLYDYDQQLRASHLGRQWAAVHPTYVRHEGFLPPREPGGSMFMPPTVLAPWGRVPGEGMVVPSFAHEPTSSRVLYDYDQQSRASHLGRQWAAVHPTYVRHEGFLPPREPGGSMFMPPTVLAPWGRVPGEGMVVPFFAHEPTSSRVLYDYDQQSRASHLGRQWAAVHPTYVRYEGFLPPREPGGSMFMPPTVLAPWERVPGKGMVVPSFAHEPTSSRVLYDYDQQSRASHLGRQWAAVHPTYVRHEGVLPPREPRGSMFMPPTAPGERTEKVTLDFFPLNPTRPPGRYEDSPPRRKQRVVMPPTSVPGEGTAEEAMNVPPLALEPQLSSVQHRSFPPSRAPGRFLAQADTRKRTAEQAMDVPPFARVGHQQSFFLHESFLRQPRAQGDARKPTAGQAMAMQTSAYAPPQQFPGFIPTSRMQPEAPSLILEKGTRAGHDLFGNAAVTGRGMEVHVPVVDSTRKTVRQRGKETIERSLRQRKEQHKILMEARQKELESERTVTRLEADNERLPAEMPLPRDDKESPQRPPTTSSERQP